jgi:hypothetical protein
MGSKFTEVVSALAMALELDNGINGSMEDIIVMIHAMRTPFSSPSYGACTMYKSICLHRALVVRK